jgi:hypothetical protein
MSTGVAPARRGEFENVGSKKLEAELFYLKKGNK